MSADARWQRLQELFDTLIALPASEREHWLDANEPNADLRREVLDLIGSDDSGEQGLTGRLRGAAARALNRTADGLVLGPYRLGEEIGSGGMGSVFIAERVDETFDQRVAVKLLRGVPTRESTERFRRERQILADLSHPHIARLIDGGNTGDGQPYLVMEFVEGVPIDAFCREHALSLRQRLQLLLKVCAAVQYAHQHLIIHRDIKPANVLVRADGEPVLLDFGIAKLLADTGDAAQQTGLRWFTPAYASPEQRKGEAVSTATDVHGLGLLLHELVAETPPQRDAAGRLPPPSRAASRTTRPRVPTEIDLIAARATHEEPERRYASAAALAEDIQRFLRGRPIHAAPDSVGYRISKFIRRHRLATVAMLAAILLAGAFTWRLARERDRALRAEAEAREQSATAQSVVDYLVSLFKSASPDEAGIKPISPRDLVDRGRREIDARLAGAPAQRARLLGALGRIYLELGLPEDAAASLGEAADLERDHGTPRQRAAYLADEGLSFNLAERPDDAVPVLENAFSLLGAPDAKDATLASDILTTLGLAQSRSGDPAAGAASIRRAMQYVAADSIPQAKSLYALAEADMRAGHLDVAEQGALRSLAIMRKHLPDDAEEVLQAKGFLSQVYEQQGRYGDGEKLLREMLEVRLRTLDPGSAWAMTARNNLAQAIQLQGRIVEATALLRENVERMRANRQQDSASYLISLNNLASLLEQAGDYRASLAMFREVQEQTAKDDPLGNNPRTLLFRQNLGRSLMLNGQLDAAHAILVKPIEGNADSLDLNIERARRLAHLAEWARRSGQLPEALAYADQARTAFLAIVPAAHPRLGSVARTRGLILRDAKRLDEAETELREADAILSKALGDHANATLDTELQLARLLYARGNFDEARRLADKIAPLLDTRFVQTSDVRSEHAELSRRLAAATPG